MSVNKLSEESMILLNNVSDKMGAIQAVIDVELLEYQKKLGELEVIKQSIRPLREELSPLAELKASIASRKSRAKYFPQFATRNFDESKDKEFLEFVRAQLNNPDKE